MLITGMHHDYETIILTQAHAIYVTKLAKISNKMAVRGMEIALFGEL